MKQCTGQAECYMGEMEKSSNQEQATQFVAIKSGYMAAILGGEAQRDELVKRIESFENAAVRFVAAQTIDHLSPKGSKRQPPSCARSSTRTPRAATKTRWPVTRR